MAENTNPFAPFASYDEWLKAYFASYCDLDDNTKSKLTREEQAQTAVQQAKTKLRKGWRRTILVGAGLIIGTALTGGLLGAGLGIWAASAGIGVLGVSLGAGVASWKTIAATLFRGSQNPDIAEARAVRGLANHQTLVDALQQRLENEQNPQKKMEILKQLEVAVSREMKFLSKYSAKVQKSKTALYAHGGSRKRDGFWGSVDKIRQSGQKFSSETIGTLHWVNKQYQAEQRFDNVTNMLNGAVSGCNDIAARNGLKLNDKLLKPAKDAYSKDQNLAKQAGYVQSADKFEDHIDKATGKWDYVNNHKVVQQMIKDDICTKNDTIKKNASLNSVVDKLGNIYKEMPLEIIMDVVDKGYTLKPEDKEMLAKVASDYIISGRFANATTLPRQESLIKLISNGKNSVLKTLIEHEIRKSTTEENKVSVEKNTELFGKRIEEIEKEKKELEDAQKADAKDIAKAEKKDEASTQKAENKDKTSTSTKQKTNKYDPPYHR